jgi:CPA2 family monovalent cation:H+ antiporter-2
MSDNVIYDLLVILTAGLIAGLACKRLRVPVLIGYILVGVLIGAGGLGLIHEQSHDIEKLAEAGVLLRQLALLDASGVVVQRIFGRSRAAR